MYEYIMYIQVRPLLRVLSQIVTSACPGLE